jgi:hypothetical protein
VLRHLAVGLLSLVVLAQPPQTITLRGTVTDPSGAIVPGATVSISSGPTTTANNDGVYTFTGLKPGDYTVQASAPGLALPKPIRVTLRAGNVAPRTLAIQLQVASQKEQITVGETPTSGPTVSTEASENASSVVIKGKDLDALADDPNDLAADLQALAGPAAGPNGGAIFIDGFSGGEMPSKEAIREIRINQNPFSSEYDKLGFGRIEIFTKPGSDKFKGSIYYNFADDFWNSRNPYAAQKAPFRLYEYGGSLSGPVGKRASFFLDLRRDDIGNGAIINGAVVDPVTLAVVNPYTSTFLVPQKRLAITPRVDYQLSANHTLTARYSFTNTDIAESGIGSFNLVSRGVHASNDSHVLQLTETAIIGTHAVNETRFQFFRVDTANLANDTSPSLQVIGSFNGGGSQFGQSTQLSNSCELQNNTSIMRGRHSLRFGVRIRGEALDSISPMNFGGTFTFAGGPAPGSTGVVDSLERYRRTLYFSRLGYMPAQIRAAGGGASQFTLNAGDPLINAGQTDAGLFIADDWRVRPNLTISTGLRYETQTNIHDRRDFAPRFAMAWAPGRAGARTKPKSVIRAGFGMFYDRFALAQTINALRYNGVRQQQFVITNPDFFPNIPPVGILQNSASQQTIQRVSADLRAPYVMQSALSFERSLPFQTSVAVTYANTHGLHMLRSQNVNAPANPIFEVQSAGLYNQNQIITNVNTKVNKNVSLFGSYIWNRARSNTDGPGTFPSKPYSFVGEYGPASTDVHNRATIGGTLTAKWDIRLNPLFVLDSGPPFDITAGRDLYGSTLFNARPGFATDPTKPGLIATSYGLLDPNPSPGQPLVPRNFGRGPGSVVLNLRIGKTFSFGFGEGHEAPTNIPGGGMTRSSNAGVFSPTSASGPARTSRRYNITISMSIRNLLNHTNPGPIIGNITSPLFGQANQPAGGAVAIGSFSEAANNRRLELQTRFTF